MPITKYDQFNQDMVKALLDGRKTQTRRTCKPQPITDDPEFQETPEIASDGTLYFSKLYLNTKPKYRVGDIIGVKEKLIRWCESMSLDYPYYAADKTPVVADRDFIDLYDGIRQSWCWKGNTRQAYHMPKWACRIFLKVTKVRVERIQDLSEADAIAEGVDDMEAMATCAPASIAYIGVFSALWESCHPGSWDRNDWVFVYDFEECEKP